MNIYIYIYIYIYMYLFIYLFFPKKIVYCIIIVTKRIKRLSLELLLKMHMTCTSNK